MRKTLRQRFHLEPPAGLLNDPNGLAWYRGVYHVYFQWNKFEKNHSYKEWGSFASDDLVHWQFQGSALVPDQPYDQNGVYSGSALEIDGKLCLYYTGNVKHQGLRNSRQCLAVTEDGRRYLKLGPVLEKPDGYTPHFRDPKVFRGENGWYYMLIGAQQASGRGALALARSRGDFRIPAVEAEADGVRHTQLDFASWRALEEKPAPEGLPAAFADPGESATLEITLSDPAAGLTVRLYYTLFAGLGIVARHQVAENTGTRPLTLHNLQSASLELPALPWEMLTLYGTHAKEANGQRFPLHHGVQRIESVRGSSSPQHQPFFALLSPDVTADRGLAVGFHLVYSGNFLAQAELDQFGMVRAQIGLHPDGFAWQLMPGERFTSPEAILNCTTGGLNGLRQNFHQLYLHHLMPPRFAEAERPILLNSWESMYYDVTLSKIERQAELARQLGVELFVLDDGWFRKGNSSRDSMGDWRCNLRKLPGGIPAAARIVHGKGMKFGLWFEPEAVTADSDLFRQHPDWVLQTPGYSMTQGRHEYLLDLSRPEVVDYLFDVLDGYLQKSGIDYIKWDMNRPLTDFCSLAPGARQGETAHRYVLGLYRLLERITTAYPRLLIEGCSSGGARFDPGMLYYVAQNWTSDNTDGHDRLAIQAGYSLLYPPVAMGAHVSITPNHQTGRVTPLDTRWQAARLFNLGYELDLTLLTPEELADLAGQIAQRKAERRWVQSSRFFTLDLPGPYTGWAAVAQDGSRCLVQVFQTRYDPLFAHTPVRLSFLDRDGLYRDAASGQLYGGDELATLGLTAPLIKQDDAATVWELIREPG